MLPFFYGITKKPKGLRVITNRTSVIIQSASMSKTKERFTEKLMQVKMQKPKVPHSLL